MPELPEIETIKNLLKKPLIGKRIEKVEVLSKKQFPQDPKQVIGARIKSIDRFAKIFIIKLDNGKSLVIHLKLSGQLVWVKKGEKQMPFGHPVPYLGTALPAKSTRVITTFENGRLFFNDLRKFGWIKIMTEKEVDLVIGELGVEPLSKKFTLKAFSSILQSSRRAVKVLLMDQAKISGIGNIYANEALFEAGIDPRKPANKISQEKVKALREAIIRVLKKAIVKGGSSGRDEMYIKPDGSKGNYQNYFKVYQREGQSCKKCEGVIKRINLSGRGTFFCPSCQK